MRRLIHTLLAALLAIAAHAQIMEPVKFKTELKNVSPTEIEIVFTGTIDPGWHVYSTNLGDGGPISATFNTDRLSGAELVDELRPAGKEISAFDKLFEMQVRYFEQHTAQFAQTLKLTGGAYEITGYLEYGACNDENCLPPTQVEFSFKGHLHLSSYPMMRKPTFGHPSSGNWTPLARPWSSATCHGSTSSAWVLWADCWRCSPRACGPSSL